ncbi:MAG: hypothetical protein HQK49_20660 [Oligoflexia bacterium]|nr:hypothetical protein [Oligoflexia bacterium]
MPNRDGTGPRWLKRNINTNVMNIASEGNENDLNKDSKDSIDDQVITGEKGFRCHGRRRGFAGGQGKGLGRGQGCGLSANQNNDEKNNLAGFICRRNHRGRNS